jgi:predicted transcriptional regulator
MERPKPQDEERPNLKPDRRLEPRESHGGGSGGDHDDVRALPRREREILDVLLGSDTSLSAEAIRDRLADPPSYSAVRALLARLESRGVAAHQSDGVRHLYSPRVPRREARRGALDRLVGVFFGGSAGSAAAALLRRERWTAHELDELEHEIRRAREKNQRSGGAS